MTPNQMLAASRKYAELLYPYPSERADPGFALGGEGRNPHQGTIFGHVRWMCLEIPQLVAAGRLEKAGRWLGFVQGILWANGYMSIDALKDDNRAR